MTFEEWLQNEGKRKQTIDVYVRSVRQFFQWLEETEGEKYAPDEVSAKWIHEWKDDMKKEKIVKGKKKAYSPATIRKRIASLKVYWSYLIDTGQVMIDPTKKVKLKRESPLDDTPRWLTDKEQTRLLNHMAKDDTKWGKRDLAIVRCMLQAGLRISEVKDLKVHHFHKMGKSGVLEVLEGKGGKPGHVPANRDVTKAIESWLEERGECDTDALFVSYQGKPMSRQAIHKLIKKHFLEALGENKASELSAHALRHTFCKNLLDSGVDLTVVSKLARHESLETTRRYVTPSLEEQRRAVEQLSDER